MSLGCVDSREDHDLCHQLITMYNNYFNTRESVSLPASHIQILSPFSFSHHPEKKKKKKKKKKQEKNALLQKFLPLFLHLFSGADNQTISTK